MAVNSMKMSGEVVCIVSIQRISKMLPFFAAVICAPLAAETQLTIEGTRDHADKICGFPGPPEDLEMFPDGRHLLASSYGGLRGQAAFPLQVVDPVSLKTAPILTHYQEDPEVRWDESLCPSPPKHPFPAHGIHLSQRNNESWQLLAVNHERESVEFFEVVLGEKSPELTWRGCIVMPEDSLLNDLVALPGGGFLVSHMITLGDHPEEEAVKVNEEQGPTGHVWRWQPGLGIDKLPGSEGGNFTNGVEISPDGASVFIAETGTHRVKKVRYDSGEFEREVSTGADNLSWSPDGRLVIAGATEMPDEACLSGEGACRVPFEVRAVEPETLNSEVLYSSDGAPMGAGTVAVILNEYMYVGTFLENCFLRVRLETAVD